MTTPDLTPQELMKALGSKGGYFDPIPPDQHAWPMMLDTNPGINVFRLWSWMCAHTIRKGRRKGYVCDERGKPLSVEDAAHDLKIDPGVCRRAWREGEALGLWHKGAAAAGSNKRTLHLNGKVIPVAVEPEEGEESTETEGEEAKSEEGAKGEEGAKQVCTDLFPPYLRLQIKRLPKSTRKKFESEYERNERLYKDVHADVTVAVRLIFDQRENTIFDTFGIKKIREEHTPKNGAAKSPVRVQLVQEFLPGLEKFVQTFEERSVQAPVMSVQTKEDPVVQTAQNPPKITPTPAPAMSSNGGAKRAVLESQSSSLPTSISSSAVPLSPEPPRGKAEEEEKQSPYEQLKAQYPAGHFDEPKTKPSFEGKTKTQQRHVIERLHVYLECERWKDDGGKWIPFSSKWLETYESDPPAAMMKKQKTQSTGAGATEESFVERQYRELLDKRRKADG